MSVNCFFTSLLFFSITPLWWKLLLLGVSSMPPFFLFFLCIIPTCPPPRIFNWLYSFLCLSFPILCWVDADPSDCEGGGTCCSWHMLGICVLNGSLPSLSLSLLELSVCVGHYPFHIHKCHCCPGLALAWKRLGEVEWA